MNTGNARLLIVAVLSLLINGCRSSPSPTPASLAPPPVSPTLTPEPTPTPVPPTLTPEPEGRIVVVDNSADSGSGTLRQALIDAEPYDTIIFDPVIFSPDAPQTIGILSELPLISRGNLTIDASDAGVIMDGSQLPEGSWIPGLQSVSDGNVIRGLQVVNFTGPGIAISGGRYNTIGGDRSVGVGPIGQAILSSGNDFGIGLWGSASNNLVTGNLIGTDVSGVADIGNRSSGVMMMEGANGNVVGPNNVIAYNDRCGAEVWGSDTFGNTVTQNRIYDSGVLGICTLQGGNTTVPVPLIMEFDLSGGLVIGSTCGNCKVEIFSDSGDEGAVYEGQAVADSGGVFTFNKGAAPINANITLTATDAEGNTSQFSKLIGGETGVITLQEGNSGARHPLLTRPPGELFDNRIALSMAGSGLLWPDVSNLGEALEEIIHFGGKRVDTTLTELEPPIHWEVSELEVPAEFGDFLDRLDANGVAINYMLHYWDKAGHASGEELSTPRFQDEEQVQEFSDYVRFLVRRFKGKVPYYTIWSEPDACESFYQIKCIRPLDYINLARHIIPVIREEDPEAKVVLAPNVLFFARDYLFTILRSDVLPMFDVISWHGMYDAAPGTIGFGNYYYEYPTIVQEIKATASAHGFQGEFWGTELTWCSKEFPNCKPADQSYGQAETDIEAAKYFTRGIVMHLGMDVGVGLGGFQTAAPWSYPAMRSLNTIMAGAKPTHLEVTIDGEAANIASYGFILPSGDHLFAIWTDGKAVEDDPGASTSLIFPGLSDKESVGMDVLYGFEQDLVTETDNGNLVIRNLLVRDYPLIIRLLE